MIANVTFDNLQSDENKGQENPKDKSGATMALFFVACKWYALLGLLPLLL